MDLNHEKNGWMFLWAVCIFVMEKQQQVLRISNTGFWQFIGSKHAQCTSAVGPMLKIQCDVRIKRLLKYWCYKHTSISLVLFLLDLFCIGLFDSQKSRGKKTTFRVSNVFNHVYNKFMCYAIHFVFVSVDLLRWYFFLVCTC